MNLKGKEQHWRELSTADKIRLATEIAGVVLTGIAFAVEAASKKE